MTSRKRWRVGDEKERSACGEKSSTFNDVVQPIARLVVRQVTFVSQDGTKPHRKDDHIALQTFGRYASRRAASLKLDHEQYESKAAKQRRICQQERKVTVRKSEESKKRHTNKCNPRGDHPGFSLLLEKSLSRIHRSAVPGGQKCVDEAKPYLFLVDVLAGPGG